MRSPHVCRAALAAVAVLAAAATGHAADVWLTDYTEAVAEAERLERPLLVHFFGTYCPPCRRMEREVLHTPETSEVLTAKFVAVKIDVGGSEQNMRLVQRFGVQALPCDIVLDPLSGHVLSQKQGFQDQRSYVSSALDSSGRFEQARKTHVARKTQVKEPVGDAATSDSGSVELGEPQPLVGLDGYSPVALTQRKEWIRGQREFAWEHKGITYYLTTREELELFRAKPEDYAPRLLGCDAVVLWETDRAVPGDTRYGAFFDGELYLFQTDDTRKRFKANPSRYTRIQHVLKVDKIERTVVR